MACNDMFHGNPYGDIPNERRIHLNLLGGRFLLHGIGPKTISKNEIVLTPLFILDGIL